MKFIGILWNISKNIIALAILLGALSVTSTPFEQVAVGGLGLIYASVVMSYLSLVKSQIEGRLTHKEQFQRALKTIDPKADLSGEQELLAEEQQALYASSTNYLINVLGSAALWCFALVAVILAVLK